MVSEETLLSDRSIKMLESRGEDYLVEVFRPWNFYEREWADPDTLQIRFEREDLLVGRDPDKGRDDRKWEVLTGFEGVHQGATTGLADDNVCWLVDQSLVEEAGIFGRVMDLTKHVLDAIEGQRAV